MRKAQGSDPPFQKIDGPKCTKCGTPMWIARIEPDKPGFDKRTFECPACDHSETIIVEYRKS